MTSSPIRTVAVVGPFEPGEDAQQRRLAAAAGAEQRDRRPRGRADRDVAKHFSGTEPLADPIGRERQGT